jgi:NAD(P)-dependent dehydrogenase (short-subunit alcohol dehydrogenase family)
LPQTKWEKRARNRRRDHSGWWCPAGCSFDLNAVYFGGMLTPFHRERAKDALEKYLERRRASMPARPIGGRAEVADPIQRLACDVVFRNWFGSVG